MSKLDESEENTRPNQIPTQAFEPLELSLPRQKKASHKIEQSKDHSMTTALALNNSVEVTDMRLDKINDGKGSQSSPNWFIWKNTRKNNESLQSVW